MLTQIKKIKKHSNPLFKINMYLLYPTIKFIKFIFKFIIFTFFLYFFTIPILNLNIL